MKKVNLIFLFFIFVFCFYSVRSQCCCSSVQIALVEKKGNQLKQSEVKIKEINKRLEINEIYERLSPSSRFHFNDDKTDKVDVVYKIGCGYGDEVLSIIYKGSEMRIHFKFIHEFGRVSGKITFQKGDFIAEPKELNNVGIAKGIKARKATDEELKQLSK